MDTFKSSRNLSDMHPRLMQLFMAFKRGMDDAKIEFIVTATYRNDADQNAAYKQGRGAPGAIVTNAKSGESPHNVTFPSGKPCACAFDIVIMSNGKPDWNVNNPAWKKAGKIGKEIGLEWAGDWTTFKEYPHFQLPNWKDYKCRT